MERRRVQSYKSRPTSSKPSGPSCVICFRTQSISSIGACDHPVCYECSTTMRVLCDQKECPICRRILTKVIFTKDVDLYKNLENREYSHYNKKYGIAFDDHSVEHSFEQLMRCYCKKCYDRPEFVVFDQLAAHMEKTHRLYACRLCVKHLKIFPSQRRWYNYDELKKHEESGDPDNTSHRGHPECHFCSTRYLDKDELYKHLRKEHFYCHFCDADGIQDYYMSYHWLRQHYHDKHYLCEEGNCVNEQFTSVFRTSIDLQAHKAQMHSKELGKHGSKEARTLRLEFNLRPRRYPTVEASIPNQYQPPPDNSHVSDRTLNVRDTSDFPSLNGQHTTVLPCARTRKQNQPVNTRDFNSFPALGQEPTSLPKPPQKAVVNNRIAVAAVLKKPAEPSRSDKNKDIAAGSSGPRVPNKARDFPTLDGNQQTPNQVKETVSTSANSVTNSWVSKTKTANENGNQDEKKKNKKETPAIKNKIADAPKIPGPSDFPNLNKKLEPTKSNLSKLGNKKKVDNNSKQNSSSSIENINSSNQNGKKNNVTGSLQSASCDNQQLQQNTNNSKTEKNKSITNNNKENNKPKSKLAEQSAPQCNGNNASKQKSTCANKNAKAPEIKKECNIKKDSQIVTEKLDEITITVDPNNLKDKKKRKKNENCVKETITAAEIIKQPQEDHSKSSKPSIMWNAPKIPPGFEHNPRVQYSTFPRAPPGLSAQNQLSHNSFKAPPGLPQVTKNATRKLEYLHPVDSTYRNKVLITNLMLALESTDKYENNAFEVFKDMSTKFRKNQITAQRFFSYCKDALFRNFDALFLELTLLLPDIQKQHELLAIYSQTRYGMDVEVCSYCCQLLKSSDMDFHWSIHKDMNDNNMNF